MGSEAHSQKSYRAGSAYVFVRQGTTWTLQKQLFASVSSTNAFFGSSVAIQGNTIVVGSQNIDAVYIFLRSGTTWTEHQIIIPEDGGQYNVYGQIIRVGFGGDVDIDGDTIVVGSPWDNGPPGGSAYIFRRSGATWSQFQKINADDGEQDDSFGYSIAVSGTSIIVGAYNDDQDRYNMYNWYQGMGSAYVFGY
jgi:hypothetical protein